MEIYCHVAVTDAGSRGTELVLSRTHISTNCCTLNTVVMNNSVLMILLLVSSVSGQEWSSVQLHGASSQRSVNVPNQSC